MLKRALAGRMVRRTATFAVVFAATCLLMGSILYTRADEAEYVYEVLALPGAGQAVVDPFAVQARARLATESDSLWQSGGGEFPKTSDEPVLEGMVGTLVAQGRPRIAMNLPQVGGFNYSEDIPLSAELQRYTWEQCIQKGLEYELVLALMWRESRFQVDAVGYNTNGTRDHGLMQINDVNFGWLESEYGIDNLMDPVQNIYAGTTILQMFTDKYGVHDGLMAYQYGESGFRSLAHRGIVTNDNIALLLEKRESFKAILADP